MTSPVLRFAADENLDHDIVRGALRRNPRVDIVRIQDVGLSGATDPEVLSWAAEEGREVGRRVSIAAAIEDILLLAECGLDGEWEGQVLYLPLR